MSQIAIRYVFGVVLLAMASVLGHAQQQKEPSGPRGSHNNPYKIPTDNGTPVELKGNVTPSHPIFVKNHRRLGSIGRIRIELKVPQGNVTQKLELVSVTDLNGNNILDPSSDDGPGATAEVGKRAATDGVLVVDLAPPVSLDQQIKIRVKKYEKSNRADSEFQLTSNTVRVNLAEADLNGEPIKAMAVGENAKAQYEGAFVNTNVAPEPIVVPIQMTPGVFNTPDLVFAELTNGRLSAGYLEFAALADVEFALNSPNVFAVDLDGNTVSDPARIEFGPVTVANGRVMVEVVHRDPDDSNPVAVVLRGVDMELPQLNANQEIHYAVGGSASGRWLASSARLVVTGGSPAGHLELGEVHADVEFTSDDGTPYIADWYVGKNLYVVAGDGTNALSGYFAGVVLRESQAGAFGDGSIYLRPLDGFTIANSAETKVYILDPATGSHVPNAFTSVSLSLTGEGGARLELSGRQVPSALQIVIGNLHMDLGAGPFDHSFRLGVGGSAIPGGATLLFAEGTLLDAGETPYGLPAESFNFVNWTPVAGY